MTRGFHARGHTSKKLDYEKCFKNFILFSKKRYCGIKYEPNGKGGARCLGASHSGTANKRRDSCTFVHRIYDAMINPLLYESDRTACIEAFHEHVALLLSGQVDYDELVVTKSLKSDYKNTALPQLRVAAKQREREAGSEARSGDRLGMIFVRGPPGAKVCDLAEDADYVKQNRLPIDAVYYLRKQLETPCTSILELVHPNPAALFEGYHKEAERLRHGTPRLDDFVGGRKASTSSAEHKADAARLRESVEKRARVAPTASASKGKKAKQPVTPSVGIQSFFRS